MCLETSVDTYVSISAADNGAQLTVVHVTRKWWFHETENSEAGEVLGLAESATQGCRLGTAMSVSLSSLALGSGWSPPGQSSSLGGGGDIRVRMEWMSPGNTMGREGIGQRDRKWWVCLLKILLTFATQWPGFLKSLRSWAPLQRVNFFNWTIFVCVFFIVIRLLQLCMGQCYELYVFKVFFF